MKGFTLIELLIAVAILGILSAIGVPIYTGYVDSARVSAAQNGLRNIYVQQQEYYSDNNEYYNNISSGDTCIDYTSNINTSLFSGKNVLNNDYYTFCISRTNATDFIATASEKSGSRSYTLDQDNNTSF